MRPLPARLVRLERDGASGSPNYAVTMAAGGAIHDEEAVCQAIEEHQRRTGWMGPVLLVEPEMTEAEWLARYGRTD